MSITSKNDFPLDANSIDGTELCARLNRWHADSSSGHSNGVRPSYVTAGGTWVRDNGATATPRYELMIYNGVTDIKAGGSSFDAGTKLTFNQSAAPTGWTKLTTYDNAALRVVSGAVGDGGSIDFTTAFASHTTTGTVASHALTLAQMPNHNHSSFHAATVNGTFGASRGGDPGDAAQSPGIASLPSDGGGQGHDHGFTGGALDLSVKYVDVIICSKD
jgi:hypothetical protein